MFMPPDVQFSQATGVPLHRKRDDTNTPTYTQDSPALEQDARNLGRVEEFQHKTHKDRIARIGGKGKMNSVARLELDPFAHSGLLNSTLGQVAHFGREINAVNVAGWADRLRQLDQAVARAKSNVQHALSGLCRELL